MRTAFVGLFGGFVIYALGLVASWMLAEPWATYVSLTLMVAGLVFALVWVLAVRGGWRLGKGSTRSAKRRKDREKQVSPWARR